MANSSVKTVQFVDPRIEPQPDPIYDYVIGPTQNQYYQIPASGKSNSNLTFNNLTTLGIDRAYLDTFELEIEATITFNLANANSGGTTTVADHPELVPAPEDWTFQSFPFNSCCDEARVNINGGAFFSQPMCYVRAKERYMDQYALGKCYQNVCPVQKPVCQTESGRNFQLISDVGGVKTYNRTEEKYDAGYNKPYIVTTTTQTVTKAGGTADVVDSVELIPAPNCPTRYGRGMGGFMQGSEGIECGFNNNILRLGKRNGNYYNNYYREDGKTIVKVIWREPLFVSPFSSRYDATYGRPLYNITSMDFAFNMQDLGNMIRLENFKDLKDNINQLYVSSYSIDIVNARLCYQVMTIPNNVQKPLTTLVPYRRFVPYITDFNSTSKTGSSMQNDSDLETMSIRSGVYTMNEIPTAIWVFGAPSKKRYQENKPDNVPGGIPKYSATPQTDQPANPLSGGNWASNKLFAYLQHINISLANTTQILNTATILDLYRIAKANGCEDSFWSWGNPMALAPYEPRFSGYSFKDYEAGNLYFGAGSVLRLKPGVDIIVPDVPLIPGANANNMVLQVDADFLLPPHSAEQSEYSLWLLFEYVGVAAISPGQCEITMNPLGSGDVMAVSPVMSGTSETTEGKIEGSGHWGAIKDKLRIIAQTAKGGVASRLIKNIAGLVKNEEVKKDLNSAANWMEERGYGAPGAKRSRGGAVIGHGLNEWV